MSFTHFLAGASLAAVAATAGHAQTASQPVAGELSDGVIVVTAQKREELITDVPVTVSALSGEQLQRINVDEFDELSAFVPGLVVQEQSANNPGFVIRGITSDSGSAQIAPRVTIYYNGVDVSRSRGSYFKLYDIERVEVVKGPQATLFGTAATIGAISVVPAKPEQEPGAFAQASYGNFGAVQVNGMVNTGGETVSARIAGFYETRDGYVRNIAGEPGTASADLVGVDQDDLNGIDQFGLRGSVRAFLGEGTADLTVTYEEQNNPGTAFKSGSIPPTGGDTSPFTFAELGGSPFSEEALGIDELKLERQVLDVNLTAEFPLSDALTLTSVSGYRNFDSVETFDADGSPLFYLEFGEDAQGEQMSTELRLAYDNGGMIRGFVGGNIFVEDGTQGVPFSTDEGTYLACAPFAAFAPVQAALSAAQGGAAPCVGADGALNAANASAILTGGAADAVPYASSFTNGGDNSSYSVFADATIAPMDGLELTAGVRYLYERRRSTYSNIQPQSQILAGLGIPGQSLLGTADTGGQVFSVSDEFDAWLPRFNALYELTPGINVYGTVSKGRRAPVLDLGAQASAAGTIPDFTLVEEERVWNYEGGIKGALGGVVGSVGVFYQDYSNFQTSFFDETGSIVPVNAGTASNVGVEAEAQARIFPWLNVFGSYAYIDAKIDAPDDGGASDYAGSRFRLQPRHSAAAGLEFSYDLGSGTALSLTPTVTYRSKVFFEIPNTEAISEGGYTLVNLRGAVSFMDDRYSIFGFATNLLDKDYIIDAGNTGGGFGTATFIQGEPAFYGAGISARF
ncbi:TonB-dependent receptor [Pacificimonas flava]|uniref:TonB-dependent receptor n=1 Tax=Pacificimonas flava TaxID=1234595 RepID=M2T870_9SPHN|nr:TonB-dependent receptor [Pacificimonas flava]EMD82724.1 TonB-dependent receptor [Pacificimonas flava]MBB5279343.1 outer membrane receptor protein involved in Fe transport [Pacificimonas flava]